MDKRKRHSVLTIVLFLIVGCIFIALGTGIFIALISSLIKSERSASDIYVIVPLILLVLLPIAFGSMPLIMAIKQIYYIVREKKANKSAIETTARILDYKAVRYNGKQNKWYALKLVYFLNGEQKTFTTDYLYDINELTYLRSLSHIKIKVNGNFVVVAEAFSKDIYKIHSKYGIPIEFFEQSTVKKTLRIWQTLVLIAITFFIISIVLTTTLHNGIYLMTGAIILFAVNIPFIIILVICLIKWIKSKRK